MLDIPIKGFFLNDVASILFLKKLSFYLLCLLLLLKIVFFISFEKNFGTPSSPLYEIQLNVNTWTV